MARAWGNPGLQVLFETLHKMGELLSVSEGCSQCYLECSALLASVRRWNPGCRGAEGCQRPSLQIVSVNGHNTPLWPLTTQPMSTRLASLGFPQILRLSGLGGGCSLGLHSHPSLHPSGLGSHLTSKPLSHSSLLGPSCRGSSAIILGLLKAHLPPGRRF